MPLRPGQYLPPSAPCPKPPVESPASQTWDYGFKRLIPLLEFPTVGAGILATTFFFFIAFLSDVILARITPMTLGIVVTLSTIGLIALIILILIML